MKKDIRTLGIDDVAFHREKSSKTFIFGVIVRGNHLVEGIIRSEITVDGWDATKKIINMIRESKFMNQVKAIILGSATIAAFNIINIVEIFQKTSIPIVTILNKLPKDEDVKKALTHLPDWEKRLKVLIDNPNFERVDFKNPSGRECSVYVQHLGFKDINEIKNLLQSTTHSGCVPESLRVADLIGQSFKNYSI